MIKIEDIHGLLDLVNKVNIQTEEVVHIALTKMRGDRQMVEVYVYERENDMTIGIKADWDFELNNKAEKHHQAYTACKNYLTALLNGGVRC